MGEDEENNSRRMLIASQWSGPLPPPSILADFDAIVPGGAGRIFDQFEQEAHHRRARERKSDTTIRVGQVLAGLFAAGMISLAAFAFFQHANVGGTLIGGGVITTGIIAFLGGTEFLRRKK